MKRSKGFVMSTYVYVLLTFFLLILATMLIVLNNTKLISKKIKDQANDIYSGVKYTKSFQYTGEYQEFVVPYTGRYKIELWGAEGGSAIYKKQYYGGKGSYTKGEIHLETGEKFYVYVGGKGGGSVATDTTGYEDLNTGYNGGGYGSVFINVNNNNSARGGGGGATDIRYFGTVTPSSDILKWNSSLGLASRLMVAAGGGGAASHNNTPNYSGNGGYAGGLIGQNGVSASSTCYSIGVGANQKNKGGHQTCSNSGEEYGSGSITLYASEAGFGYGGNYSEFKIGNVNSEPKVYITSSGGGAGYYGGGAGWQAPAAGGSSYISGHNGCIAVKLENGKYINRCSSASNVDCSYHYSGKKFINTVMIDGGGYIWTTQKGTYKGQIQPNGQIKKGHSGNGYAIITYLGK